MVSYHLIITGLVQGVFYRDSARKKAEELGVKGWIKNLEDGNVEALITAEEVSLKAFIEWCKVGPAKARVKDVQVEQRELKEFSKFEITR
jgi:acylphosphatase